VIVVGDSRNKRQLIQRLGQSIEARSDGSHGRLVVVYVEGTSEDDEAVGASPYVLGLLPHAAKVEHFTGTETDAVHAFIGTHALA
jgi:nicotinamide riboside kinase